MLGVQIITRRGAGDALHPHADLAFKSVENHHARRQLRLAAALPARHGRVDVLHRVYIHIFRGMYYGSYKEPREILWILGVIIYLLMMATGFLGYTLPWGQMSFWGATVITNFFSAFRASRPLVTWLWAAMASAAHAQPLLLAALPAALRDRGVVDLARLGAARFGSEQSGRHRPEVDKDTVPFTPMRPSRTVS